MFHPVTCSISLVAEKSSRSDIIHREILVKKCCTEIKPYLLWVSGTPAKQSLVLGLESTLQVVVSDVVKLRGVLSGPYLSVYSNGNCLACNSGLLKEQILCLPVLKKVKAFLEGEKAKLRESKVAGEERRSSVCRTRVLTMLRRSHG